MSIYKFINDLVNGNWADAVAIVHIVVTKSTSTIHIELVSVVPIVEVRRREKQRLTIRLIPNIFY